VVALLEVGRSPFRCPWLLALYPRGDKLEPNLIDMGWKLSFHMVVVVQLFGFWADFNDLMNSSCVVTTSFVCVFSGIDFFC
jgi:hypothetical protein